MDDLDGLFEFLGEISTEETWEISPEKYQAISRRVDECMEVAAGYFKVEFIRPAIICDLTGLTAGMGMPSSVRLNRKFLTTEWDDMLNNTLPHEVAHSIQYQLEAMRGVKETAHGPIWRSVMRLFGVKANTTHSYASATPARKRRR